MAAGIAGGQVVVNGCKRLMSYRRACADDS